jgi:FkbM family methyltransferase
MTSKSRPFDQMHEQCEYIEFQGRRWLWPKRDTKLKAVNDWVGDVNSALLAMAKAGRKCRVVIQAGGACGIWPVALAEHFDLVLTYEPDRLNFWCLTANCSHLPEKIQAVNAALGEINGQVNTVLHPSEKGNVGAYYTMDATPGIGDPVPRVTLDDVPLYACDLICLDIEGREVEALRGAHGVIEKYQPFIMIEEKPLPQMGPGQHVNHQPGEATEWLEKIHGYRVIDKVHRDVILAPPESRSPPLH